MCWYGPNVRHVAEEDMKVQKVFHYHKIYKAIISPMYLMEWKRGILPIRIDIPEKPFLSMRYIEEGYHCCREIKIRGGFASDYISVNKNGFSSVIGTGNKTIMLNCIIPKGTVYYEDRHGFIVCEQLMLM